jgi:benzoyl-CoA reductase/2-hydroxyglutaryl-CoA dehydratase subunit BcrC/BadD/HgdB
MRSRATAETPEQSVRRLGFTTTVPVEAILASKRQPVDLNNALLSNSDPAGLVEWAEARGFPRSCCAWIKGIYSVVVRERAAPEVVGVVRGDCSATSALLERLELEGIPVVPFSFPYSRGRRDMARELGRFVRRLGVHLNDAEQVRTRLAPVRAALSELDRLTWQDGVVTGAENHHWLVSSSDFWGDPDRFERVLGQFLRQAKDRKPCVSLLRLGYVGVPGIFSDLYETVERMGVHVVFNETQRQFSMPCPCRDLVAQYVSYTYPYNIFARIQDIRRQVHRRGIHGLIHYVQSFCFRQIQDYALRRRVDVPILTLEGDRPGPLDARSRLRLESFVEMLAERRSR